jgi:hypothetical protein
VLRNSHVVDKRCRRIGGAVAVDDRSHCEC